MTAKTLSMGMVILGALSSVAGHAESKVDNLPRPSVHDVTFEKEIKPLLERSCMGCHGATKPKGGFRIDSRERIIKGGESGETGLLPGNSANSLLVRYTAGLVKEMEMPPLDNRHKYPPLTDSEISLVRAWIDQGAKWPEGLELNLVESAAGDERKPGTESARNENQQLFEKIRSGDEEGISRAMQNRLLREARDEAGNTPLIQAAFYLTSKQLVPFIENAEDLNESNNFGLTPLMKAVPDLEKTRLLLKHGAKVNAASKAGNTALIIACRSYGSAEVVKLLLEHGANVTAVNHAGANAITAAAETGDAAVLRILLEHGGNPNSTVRIVEANAEVSALMVASQLGHLECVKLLMDRGANINLILPVGNALHFAVFTDRQEVVRLLLDRGIQVNVPGRRLLSFRNDTGFTPLIYAAMNERNDPTVVRWLLERGADVNAKASSGETPLSLARLRGETKIPAILLAAGAKDLEKKPEAKSMAPLWNQDKIEQMDAALVRKAAERGLSLLLKSGSRLTEATENRCSSCHQQAQPAIVSALALEKGFDCSKEMANEQFKATVRAVKRGIESAIEEPLPVPSIAAWTLIGLHACGYQADLLTDNLAYSLARYQFHDGRWITKAARAPTDYSDVTSTALAIKALQLYAPPTMKAHFNERIDHAAKWLQQYTPGSTEERALQLLGLSWAGHKGREMNRMVNQLLAEQRNDGGWAQISTLESDAYAAGLSLYALNQAGGLAASNEAYRKGIQFLLKNQMNDGSWYVRTRSSPVQVAIDDVFSHGNDQWISSVATTWSTLALILAYPPDTPAGAINRRAALD